MFVLFLKYYNFAKGAWGSEKFVNYQTNQKYALPVFNKINTDTHKTWCVNEHESV